MASVTRPVPELKGFRRIHLKPEKKRKVEFTLRTQHLAFYDGRMQLVTEPSSFHVWIAPDSTSGPRGGFEVVR